MQIKEKDFDKLKQLDRIEALLRKQDINNRWNYFFSSDVYSRWFIFALLALPIYTIFGTMLGLEASYFKNILTIFTSVLKVIVVVSLLDYILTIVFQLKRLKAMKALREKYFNFKVHVKKKNGR